MTDPSKDRESPSGKEDLRGRDHRCHENGEATWVVYLLRCADGSIYCGVTNNLEKRLDAHQRGVASRYTRARLPVKLLAAGRQMEKAEAYRLECRIKRLPRQRKKAALQKDGGKAPV